MSVEKRLERIESMLEKMFNSKVVLFVRDEDDLGVSAPLTAPHEPSENPKISCEDLGELDGQATFFEEALQDVIESLANDTLPSVAKDIDNADDCSNLCGAPALDISMLSALAKDKKVRYEPGLLTVYVPCAYEDLIQSLKGCKGIKILSSKKGVLTKERRRVFGKKVPCYSISVSAEIARKYFD